MQTYLAARLGSPFELSVVVSCVQTCKDLIVYALSLNNAVAAWFWEATGAVHATDFCSVRPLQLVINQDISCLQDSPGPGSGVNKH